MSQRGKDANQILTEAHDNFALKQTTSGVYTYIAIAPLGTSQSDTKWQAFRVDTTSGTVITWADGDDKFDNIATDLTALSYS